LSGLKAEHPASAPTERARFVREARLVPVAIDQQKRPTTSAEPTPGGCSPNSQDGPRSTWIVSTTKPSLPQGLNRTGTRFAFEGSGDEGRSAIDGTFSHVTESASKPDE